jgi:hypothetical protein
MVPTARTRQTVGALNQSSVPTIAFNDCAITDKTLGIAQQVSHQSEVIRVGAAKRIKASRILVVLTISWQAFYFDS